MFEKCGGKEAHEGFNICITRQNDELYAELHEKILLSELLDECFAIVKTIEQLDDE